MRAFAFAGLLSLLLSACSTQRGDDSWSVQGEVPFDGKLIYSK